MNKIFDLYKKLMEFYGPQGWWPLMREINGQLVNWYHKGDYSYPHNKQEIFEICIGAILTQNTNWKNVVKALKNLYNAQALEAETILKINDNELKELIRPAGYYNQKTGYLKNFARFFITLGNRTPTRQELLKVKGIGKETADSMLLYAWHQPHFVVDAYTRRIFSSLDFFDKNAKYDDIKQLFEQNLPREVPLYQEYHALIVEHGKQLQQASQKTPKHIMAITALSNYRNK